MTAPIIPASDLLKQAADVIRELQQCISVGRPAGKLHAHAADVLALIDGQASAKHPDSVLLDSGVICYQSRNEFGDCRVLHRGLDLRACITAAIQELQPTKGEGE